MLEYLAAEVRTGKAVGCRVMALLTIHGQSVLVEAGADWIVRDMRSVVLDGREDGSGACDGNHGRGIVSVAVLDDLRSEDGWEDSMSHGILRDWHRAGLVFEALTLS